MLSHKGSGEVTLPNVDYCNPPVITEPHLLMGAVRHTRGVDGAVLFVMAATVDKLLQAKAAQNTLRVT